MLWYYAPYQPSGGLLQNENFQLGNATSVTAASEGEPGNRYFYLSLESERGVARLWLEKEQLFQLALAVQRLLSSVSPDEPTEGSDSGSAEDMDRLDLEFVIEKLVLGKKNVENSFFLNAVELQPDEEELSQTRGNATVEVQLSRTQLECLSNRALEVCAAGRPLCPLCGVPIGIEKHRCSRTNGHVKI